MGDEMSQTQLSLFREADETMNHKQAFIKQHPMPWTIAVEPRSQAEILDEARRGLAWSRETDEAILSDPDAPESTKAMFRERDDWTDQDVEDFWVDMTDRTALVIRDANGKTITHAGEDGLRELLARVAVFQTWKPEYDDEGWDMVQFWAIGTISAVCGALSMESMYLPDFLRQQLVFEALERNATAFADALLKRKPLEE